ncbi:MAG: DUF3828 domain-containing protein [Pseudomonadota bacterium]
MFHKNLAAGAAVAASVFGVAFAADEPAAAIQGKWRITRAVVAPWTDEAGVGEQPAWIGEAVAFRSKSVKGPHPIACGGAKYETGDVPVEGLFQGAGLTSNDAIALGLAGDSFAGVFITCDTGVFDYFRASDDSLLLALDNRIWTLDRTAGTRASKNSPEGVVQRFLETHFAGDMGFWPSALEGERSYFSQAFAAGIDAYFTKIQNPDEVPAIDGDPFSDSQEYPARFAVRADDKTKPGVAVPVEFADAFRKRMVVFELARENGRWLINDLRFEDGTRLSALLSQ